MAGWCFKVSVHPTTIGPSLRKGDLVIMFSDGLRDNLHDREARTGTVRFFGVIRPGAVDVGLSKIGYGMPVCHKVAFEEIMLILWNCMDSVFPKLSEKICLKLQFNGAAAIFSAGSVAEMVLPEFATGTESYRNFENHSSVAYDAYKKA